MFNLRGHVAVITGATGEIGEQLAQVLSEQGAHVALIGTDMGHLKKICSDIGKKGKMAISVQCDISKPAELDEAIGVIIEEFGQVDILVNNGIGILPEGLHKADEVTLHAVLTHALNSMFMCCQKFVLVMRKVGYGRIVNVSSGLEPFSTRSNLTAEHLARGTIASYTRALSFELGGLGITVNAVCPGYFRTERTREIMETVACRQKIYKFCPLGRPGLKDELNGAVVYLASEEASYTTGAVLCVDGGWAP